MLLVLVCFLGACSTHAPPTEISVQQMWINKGGDSRPHGDIADYNLPYQRMQDVVAQLPPERFDREFERLVDSPVSARMDNSEFDWIYLQTMIGILEIRHDDARLIRLLASHCPTSTFDPIEWDLACNSDHPIEILEKAYRAAKTPEARANLVIVFRRTFPDIAKGVTDDLVVNSCINWYTPRKPALVVNSDFASQYGLQATSNRQSMDDLPEEGALPMFILRSEESPANRVAREGMEKYIPAATRSSLPK